MTIQPKKKSYLNLSPEEIAVLPEEEKRGLDYAKNQEIAKLLYPNMKQEPEWNTPPQPAETKDRSLGEILYPYMKNAKPSWQTDGDDMLLAEGGKKTASDAVKQPEKPQTEGLSIRYNNPGNVKVLTNKNDPWQGQRGVGKDNIVEFDTLENGLRALGVNLRSYYERHGIDTISSIVDRWAKTSDPKNQSNPEYKQHLSTVLGVDKNKKINVNDKDTLTKLMKGMIKFESGRHLCSDEQISKAADVSIAHPLKK